MQMAMMLGEVPARSGAPSAASASRDLKTALEGARAASLAAHAAVGLAWPLHRQAARALRVRQARAETLPRNHDHWHHEESQPRKPLKIKYRKDKKNRHHRCTTYGTLG